MPEELEHVDHIRHADEVIEAENPQAAAAFGREVRFGLSMIGLLLAILGVALYVKLGAPGWEKLPWSKREVAAAPEVAKASEQKMPARAAAQSPFDALRNADSAQMLAMPDPTVDAGAASPDGANGGNDRYVGGYIQDSPPTDPPFPVGAAAEAMQPINPEAPSALLPAVEDTAGGYRDSTVPSADSQGNWAPTEAPPFDPSQPAGARAGYEVEQSGGALMNNASGDAVPANFASTVDALPGEPQDGPLVPIAEPALQPQAERDGSVQAAGAREPALIEPHNDPYGRNTPHDRMAAGSIHKDSNSQLERQLQSQRTPHYENAPQYNNASQHNGYGSSPNHAVPNHVPQQGIPPLNELDAPAAEFAAPQDDLAHHPHAQGHTPTAHGTYEVMPNDSFWTISQKVYGTPGYFKAIQRHNRKPGEQAAGLEIGEKILVPPAEVLEQKYAQLCPKRRTIAPHGGRMISSHNGASGGRIYVVEQGDTLFDIARYELGKASRWAEIYELNRGQLGNDYNYIAPGTRLVLPDDPSSTAEPEPITTRPGTPYR